MESVFEKMIEKVSSYNIFNFILPGAVFANISKELMNKNFLTNSWIENIIVCYFIGMILSRIGSLVIEPILKKCKLKYAPYSDYIEASEDDPKIPMLLETNNMYRTFIATFISLIIYKGYLYIEQYFEKNNTIFNEISTLAFLIILTTIFIASFVKQTGFIRKRVEAYKKRKADSSHSSIITH
ncbi:MAG: hypothetical protein ACI4RC_01030 [Oscillospiraceae bacterium]